MGNVERVFATDVDSGRVVEFETTVQLRALIRVECNCYVCAKDGAHYIEVISTGGTMFVRNVATETSFHEKTQSGPFRVAIEETKREPDWLRD